MKKSAGLFAMTLLMALGSYSQVRLGVHADGIGASGKTESDFGDIPKSKTRFSWKAGVIAEIPIAENFSFVPELNIVSKGGKWDFTIMESDDGEKIYEERYQFKFKFTYVELPLNIVYKFNGFFGGAGLSVSLGMSGKQESTVTYTMEDEEPYTESETTKFKFDGKKNDATEEHLKAFELGANFMAGYEFSNRLFVRATYNLGLSNILPDEGSSFKNRYFGIGVGYFFGRGK